MIQCPKCGADYTVMPDVCAQCGHHFEPEEGILDPFAAAFRQEQHSRMQQLEQREAFLKLHQEKAAKHPKPESSKPKAASPAAEIPQPEPEPETDEQEPDSEILPEYSDRNRTAEQKKKPGKIWWAAAGAAMLGLLIYTGYTMRDGFRKQAPRGSSYAFYRQDRTLWLYQSESGESLRLTPNAKPVDHDIPERYLEKMTQFSADGKRIYYPTDFASSNRCSIACRSLDNPNEPIILAEIQMFPDIAVELEEIEFEEDRRMNEAAADSFTDMLPPYILEGETLFYINPDSALCRKSPGSDPEIISEKVVRYWHVDGKEGIFYLEAQSVPETSLFLPESTSSISFPWCIFEAVDHTDCSCQICYCGVSGEAEAPLHPYEETSVIGWNVSPADSSNYFYYISPTDKWPDDGSLCLYQADLRQGFKQLIDIQSDTDAVIALPLVLTSYPDGSFYYADFTSLLNTSDTNGNVHFFNRQEDKTYDLHSCRIDDIFEYADFCRTEPYYAFCYETVANPQVYYKGQAISVNLPEEDQFTSPRIPRFDTQYPVLYLKTNPRQDLPAAASSSTFGTGTDDSLLIPIDDADSMLFTIDDADSSAFSLEWQPQDICYYALMNQDKTLNFKDTPYESKTDTYFAFQPPGANKPSQFRWDSDSGAFQTPRSSEEQITDVRRKNGGLFCFSDQNRQIKLYQNGVLAAISGEDIQPDKWKSAAPDTAYAINARNELTLCKPDGLFTIDSADQLYAAGELPVNADADSNPEEEVSE